MLRANLKEKVSKGRRRFRLDTKLLELVVYIGSGLYYAVAFVFMVTVIIAGWKYILS
jgi:hypothetical protein